MLPPHLLGPHVSPTPLHPGTSSQYPLSLLHSPPSPSLSNQGHGGALPSPPPLSTLHLTGALPEDTGDRCQRAAPAPLHLLPCSLDLPQAFPSSSSSSKQEGELELHQALPTIFKTLLVLHSSPVSPSPSPIHLHCPRLKPLEPLSPLMT